MSEEERNIISESNGSSGNGVDQESKALFISYFWHFSHQVSFLLFPPGLFLPLSVLSYCFEFFLFAVCWPACPFSILPEILLCHLPNAQFLPSQNISFPSSHVLNLLMFKVNAWISQLLFPVMPIIFIRIWGSLFLHYFLTHHSSQVPSVVSQLGEQSENKVNLLSCPSFSTCF